MLTVEKIDTNNRSQVQKFIQFHYDLYKNCPQWVPPFYSDIKMMLNREKHPFYEHSDADFFLATRGSEVVGRIAVMENKPFNKYHAVRKAQFYLFDTVEDSEVTNELFARSFEWCKQRGLTDMVGPKGFSAFDGYGILVEGFEHHQMMTMMNYNYAYYPKMLEALGFGTENEFVSCYLARNSFQLPEKVEEVSRRVLERGKFKILNFRNKADLKSYADKIGVAYNKTFVNNWEYYPLSDREVKFLLDNLLVIADPQLMKVITYNDEIIGFLLAFPDISPALQRQKGKITPWGLADIMMELKRTRWVSLNGAGVLPEYHGRGGNALLYSEMAKTIRDSRFEHAELTQVAVTASQMRKDLKTVGGQEYKNHRIYHKGI